MTHSNTETKIFWLLLQGKMFQFCGKTCCDEYKKKSNMTALCEYCRFEKIIKETVRVSGIDKTFCSEGKKEQNPASVKSSHKCFALKLSVILKEIYYF